MLVYLLFCCFGVIYISYVIFVQFCATLYRVFRYDVFTTLQHSLNDCFKLDWTFSNSQICLITENLHTLYCTYVFASCIHFLSVKIVHCVPNACFAFYYVLSIGPTMPRDTYSLLPLR